MLLMIMPCSNLNTLFTVHDLVRDGLRLPSIILMQGLYAHQALTVVNLLMLAVLGVANHAFIRVNHC